MRLHAELYVKMYQQSQQQLDLLRALGLFEAAFPVLGDLRFVNCDDPLPNNVVEFLEQVRNTQRHAMSKMAECTSDAEYRAIGLRP
jgi:hypothetical protein